MKPIDISENPETTLRKHFDGLHSGGSRSHIRGGQTAADAVLATLDITGYAAKRSEVLPRECRGATVLSPYIRHNLLTLSQVWHHVHDAPARDREKFRDELLWQEYARHLYARLGTRLFVNLRFQQRHTGGSDSTPGVRNHEPNWEGELACISAVNSELREDGWLVNQTRMCFASHHTVRNGFGWLDGQEVMYRELIDGSRAANLLGWQWTVGSATGVLRSSRTLPSCTRSRGWWHLTNTLWAHTARGEKRSRTLENAATYGDDVGMSAFRKFSNCRSRPEPQKPAEGSTFCEFKGPVSSVITE